MQQDLTEKFLRVIGVRSNNRATFEIDLFDDRAASNLQRTGLPARLQKLEQVRHVHCLQGSVNTHVDLRPVRGKG